MSFSPNFVKVTLRRNGTSEKLIIQGETDGDPNELTAIYVAMAHGRNFVEPAHGEAAGAHRPLALKPEGEIKSTAPADAPNGTQWKVTLSQTRPKVKVGDTVLVIGVGVPTRSTRRPVFWHQTLSVA
jgi:hypothetical protein